MLGRLLSIAVLLGFMQPLQPSKISNPYPNTEYKTYLPLAVDTYPFVEVITTGHFHHKMGISSEYDCVLGYTIALSPSAVYSITLGVEVGDNYTAYISPVLDATLPDQKNPFSYCVETQYSSPVYLGDVKLVSTSFNPPNSQIFYPLTVTNWEVKVTDPDTGRTSISGTVRNDSGHHLVDIRVVGVLSEGEDLYCYYYSQYEADIESTSLDPDEKADFSNMCTTGVTEISAQGVAEP